MKKLLFINVLMRRDSRTRQLLDLALEKLNGRYEIEEIDLTDTFLEPLNYKTYLERQNNGEKDPRILAYAESVKNADRILIASPFWDMSFPSILKVFFERVSLFGITFKVKENGDCIGNCKAEKMLYLTSRGMDIDDKSLLDSGYNYLNAISHLFGIKEVIEVSFKKTDFIDTDINKVILEAKEKLKPILEDF